MSEQPRTLTEITFPSYVMYQILFRAIFGVETSSTQLKNARNTIQESGSLSAQTEIHNREAPPQWESMKLNQTVFKSNSYMSALSLYQVLAKPKHWSKYGV